MQRGSVNTFLKETKNSRIRLLLGPGYRSRMHHKSKQINKGPYEDSTDLPKDHC